MHGGLGIGDRRGLGAEDTGGPREVKEKNAQLVDASPWARYAGTMKIGDTSRQGRSHSEYRRWQGACLPGRLARVWLAFLITAALCAPAWGFDVHRDEKGRVNKFPPRTVAVYLHPQGLPKGVALKQVRDALWAAMDAWAGVPGAKSPLAWAGLTLAQPGYDVDVAFDAAYKVENGEVLAKTRRWADGDGHLVRAEIRLNARDVQWTGSAVTSSTQVQADLRGVLTHQLGHALGLDHSRQADATMYFYGTGTSLRTLSVDDQRAMRWLWPAANAAARDGKACDACDSDADCAAGVCLAWPDGRRSCAPTCQSSDACGIGFSCGTYAGGKACLPNDGACQPDAVKSSLGGGCASDLACGKGYCMPAAPVGFCTTTCDNCGPPGECYETSVGQLCLVRGSRKDGEFCLVPGDCASFVCAPSLAGGGHCTRSCKSGCPTSPNKWRCGLENACVPDKSPAALAVGWPCRSGFDCQSGYCLATPGGKFDRTCTEPCTVATDCPAGTGCTKIKDATWCLPSAQQPAAVGAPCPASGVCGGNLVCDEGPLPAWKACRQACDPFAESANCGSAELCVYVGEGTAKGACRPAVGGKRPLGGSCAADEPCRDDLVCVADSAALGTCRRDCDLQNAGCSAGEQCAPLVSGGRGACVPAAMVVPPLGVGILAPAAPTALNLSATTVNLPKVVAAAKWKPGATDAAGQEDGCAAGGRPGGLAGMALSGALAVALLLRRRRRALNSR